MFPPGLGRQIKADLPSLVGAVLVGASVVECESQAVGRYRALDQRHGRSPGDGQALLGVLRGGGKSTWSEAEACARRRLENSRSSSRVNIIVPYHTRAAGKNMARPDRDQARGVADTGRGLPECWCRSGQDRGRSSSCARQGQFVMSAAEQGRTAVTENA